MSIPVRLRAPICLLLAAAAALVFGPGNAFGSLTTKVTNNTDTAATTLYTCTAAATASSAFFAWPFSDTTGTTANDATTNNRDGTYLGGFTLNQSGPCPRDGGKAVTLNGTTGYVSYPTQIASPGPSTFTIEVWFNTGTVRGGKLIGYGSSVAGSSVNTDRHIYMTDGGRLVFGVYSGTAKTIISPTPTVYNDSAWHLATATLAPSGAQVGMRLYVDGALVASDTTVTTARTSAGYWRAGFDSLTGWSSAPTSNYFAGRLAFAQVYNTAALTPQQIDAHYDSGR